MKPVKPANLLLEKDLYKHDGQLIKIEANIESEFSEIESEFASIRKRLVGAVQEGKTPHMNWEERVKFSKFIATQMRRVPDKIRGDRYLAKEIVQRHIEQAHRDLNSDETPYTTPEAVDEYVDLVQMSAMIRPTPEVIQKMSQAEPFYMRIALPRCSFIVGSNPVVLVNLSSEAAIRADQVRDLFLALSHDVGVIFSASLRSPIREDIFQKSDVRKLNELVRDQSTIIAGKSCELIRSLSKKWRSEGMHPT